jgi:hypothetical protein
MRCGSKHTTVNPQHCIDSVHPMHAPTIYVIN